MVGCLLVSVGYYGDMSFAVRSPLLYELKSPSDFITNTLVNESPVSWIKAWMRTRPDIALTTLRNWVCKICSYPLLLAIAHHCILFITV